MSTDTKPIPLMLFANAVARAGVEEHMLELLRGLDRRLFRLHFACPEVLLGKYGDDIPNDVHVTPVMVDALSDVNGAMLLARTLRQQKIQILHSHMFRASLFASPIGTLCRVPVIIETPHVRETWRKGWIKSHYVVDRAIAQFVDRFIAVSEANARYLVEQKGIPAKKITVIQNGCSIERVDPAKARPQGIREGLGFSKDDLVLIAMARLEPQKGHRILLQAMAVLREQFSNARLICLGTGALEDELKKMTHGLGLDAIVRFVGFQTNVVDWLTAADIGVLPSFYEGLPLAAVETLAAGLPIVATAVDGTPEVVLDGETGLLVPAGDPAAMAAAIAKLANQPELRRKFAVAGRERVLKQFTIQRQVEQTSNLYLAERSRRVSANAELAREEAVRIA